MKKFLIIFTLFFLNVFAVEKNILVIGTGYVGLVSGTCFAEIGHNVTCLDIDEEKINNLNNNIIPIYEPGLDILIEKNVSSKRLKFTTDYESALKKADICFICVPTPSKDDGSCNTNYVIAAAREIGKYLNDYKVIVTKSTVPVGTGHLIEKVILEELNKRDQYIPFSVASNPEFLKEGFAVEDFLNPDRIVIGTKDRKAKNELIQFYEKYNDKLIFMKIESAEITKYAANTMLAARISLINQIANICREVNADINEVKLGIGSDKRIGDKFLNAGIGYGGSCFPKDVKAICKIALENKVDNTLLKAIDVVNQEQKFILAKYIENYFEGDLNFKKIAILGLAFKPNTDDIREAPSIEMIKYLLNNNVIVKAYDPIAEANTKKIFEENENLIFCDSLIDAINGCDAIAILTEWDEFKNMDLYEIKKYLKSPLIFDGRNIFNPQELREMGIKYISIGRKNNF
ncbi:MAG: UDP-glucose 6-dehydrogenase [Chlamydiae bacterium RIFCSPHIGHO2_12_FULL_27_8]|nr:MAG: UDP-glucose 6-dehydrogenase [Chlamydiae bacterium RIFCSPHIGHO2_12_FULL_27_8]OGN65523.1 MAG: UDP-glucose 6-dehydrogenase [Chlamydiae bacterium RIFCSPLOWO2_01_FULL_28_7]